MSGASRLGEGRWARLGVRRAGQADDGAWPGGRAGRNVDCCCCNDNVVVVAVSVWPDRVSQMIVRGRRRGDDVLMTTRML